MKGFVTITLKELSLFFKAPEKTVKTDMSQLMWFPAPWALEGGRWWSGPLEAEGVGPLSSSGRPLVV